MPLFHVLAMTALMLAGLAGGANAATTTVRVAVPYSLSSAAGRNLVIFEREVEASGIGLDIALHPDDSLVAGNEVPNAVAAGALEMGVASLARFAATLPAVELFQLPFLLDREELVRAATEPSSPVRSLIDAAILKTGARVLWWQAGGGTVLVARERPVRVPEDLRGRKVRVPNRILARWVELLGGEPVRVGTADQPAAYRQGTAELGMTGLSTIRSRQLDTVVKGITDVRLADSEYLVLINDAFWRRLDDRQRQLLTQVARRLEGELRDRVAQAERDALAYAREKGMTVYRPTPAELARFRAASEPLWRAFVERAGEPGKRLLDAVEGLKRKAGG